MALEKRGIVTAAIPFYDASFSKPAAGWDL
jgi:hypothetical protein